MLSTIQLTGIAMTLAGGFIFDSVLHVPPPAPVKWLSENKFTGIMMMMVLGSVANNFRTTGAFEVIFNKELVFSKLETGRPPSVPELTQMFIDSGLQPVNHYQSILANSAVY